MNGRNRNYTKVSIVVPAHNEEGNIEPLMEEFAKVIGLMNGGVEVVLVNDGSTDRTEQKMIEAARRYRWVRLVRNRVRMGLTTALAKGFGQSRGDIMVFYPADLQFHPRDIPKMIEAIDNGADMVCGKKQGRYGKWFVSWIYNLMTRILFPKLKVRDMNSVKAFTREVYNAFPTLREGWHRYLAAFAASNDFVVREVPVTLQKRHSGKSKFAGRSRILKGLTDLIAVKFQVSVFGDPMHLFGKWSLRFFFIGLLIGAGAIYLRFAHDQQIISPRPLLYAVILFELAALITFVMGIITEALVYIRDTLTDVRQQNQKLLGELNRRSGGRGDSADSGSDNQYYERSDDRVYEPRSEERREERREARPDGRRRDQRDQRERREPREQREPRETREPREAREAVESREPRESKREEGQGERRPRPGQADRRRGRDDRRPGRRDQGGRRERTPRPEATPVETAMEPQERTEAVEAMVPTIDHSPETPATPVEYEVTTSPTIPLGDDSPNVSDTGPRYAHHRSGRRPRRMRPEGHQHSQEQSSAPENRQNSQESSEIPDRPTTIKVRELPVSSDEPGENS